MSLLADFEIYNYCKNYNMIEPFVESQQEKGVISYGLSSYGYDIRLGVNFKIFHNTFSICVDPKDFSEHNFLSLESPLPVIIPPNSFVLARSYEYLRIPKDILCIVIGKSTYARCGLILNTTPLEPEWEGYITLEISNTTPLPAKIYPMEGIGQILFFQADTQCQVTYADKKGKYQRQMELTLPKVK